MLEKKNWSRILLISELLRDTLLHHKGSRENDQITFLFLRSFLLFDDVFSFEL